MSKLSQAMDFIGHHVMDEITGLMGICDSIVEYHTGSIQVSIQPRGDGKTVPDCYYIDMDNVTKQEESIRRPVTPVPEPTSFLGKKVVDSITGLKGTATKKFIYINGCERYHVTHATLTKDGMMGGTLIAAQDLVLDEPVKVEDKPKEEKKRTGGPVMKADRNFR